MEFYYPNGKKYVPKSIPQQNNQLPNIRYGKRGMTLEDDINETNFYYLAQGIAVIHKKPTPIQIVHVDYPSRSAAVIKEAYFRQPSTTDYNGVCNGKYIDFEAKETRNTTSFPLKNFHEHQITHLKNITAHGGIGFVILRFATTNEVFLLEGKYLFHYWDRMINGGRKSITKDEIMENGHQIQYGYQPRIDYIKTLRDINLL